MQLTQSLGKEIRSYIKNLLNKDVVIVEKDGTCISAVSEETIGSVITLPASAQTLQEPKVLSVADIKQLIIPLRHHNDTVGLLLIPESGDDMKTYTPLIKSFAELLIQQYEVVNKPVLDTTDQFITKVLHHANPNEFAMYESEATVLGYNLQDKRLAVVIRLDNFWQKCLAADDQASFEREEVIKEWKRKIETKITEFFSKNNDNISAYVGADTFVLFKSVTEGEEDHVIKLLKKSFTSIFEPLKNFTITDLVVGVGNAYTGLQGLIDSYREAHLALDFGSRLWGQNKSYYFGDLGILSILGEGNREKELIFAHQLLQPLTNEDLIQTLECFFDQNLNLTETAAHMGIHRNTVIYRLNQISSILGIDPRIFDQAMTIKIALLIKRLFG